MVITVAKVARAATAEASVTGSVRNWTQLISSNIRLPCS
jgi:hypothetical protein